MGWEGLQETCLRQVQLQMPKSQIPSPKSRVRFFPPVGASLCAVNDLFETRLPLPDRLAEPGLCSFFLLGHARIAKGLLSTSDADAPGLIVSCIGAQATRASTWSIGYS